MAPSPPPPVPAATLLLLRPSAQAGAPEMLMVRRGAAMSFAADAWVWPGGRIDPADELVPGVDAPRAAAVREMLEEVGVPVALSPAPDADLAARLQGALLGGATLPELLDAHGLSIDPDRLSYFGRWSPEFDIKRRFNTHFLIARLEEDLPPVRHQEGEVAQSRWVTARAMLDAIAAGEAHAIFPTVRTLERVAELHDLESIEAEGRARPLDPVVPWMEDRDGVRMICIPDGLGYPVTAVPVSSVFRGEK